MKEYFIFSINRNVLNLYHKNPRLLFLILNRIYYMKIINVKYGKDLFLQVANYIKEEEVDRHLTKILDKQSIYSKTKQEHIINNLFLNEISVLEIKQTYLKISCNKEMSSFFAMLFSYDKYFFICDFKNQEYFFLKDIKTLV